MLPLFWYFNITATYLIYTRTIGFLATIQCILMIVCSEMKVRTLVASYPKWKALYWHVQHQAIGCHKLCLNALVSRNWSKNWTYLANSFCVQQTMSWNSSYVFVCSVSRCKVDGWGFPSSGDNKIVNYCQASKNGISPK